MDLLNKPYLTIKDVQQLLGVGYKAANEILKQAVDIAKNNNYLLPKTNKLIAPTTIIRGLLKI